MVGPSDDGLDSPRANKPRSRLQVLDPSSEDHRPSTPPTPTLETAATGATMENGDRASVLSDSFMSAHESSLRAARETTLKSESLVSSMLLVLHLHRKAPSNPCDRPRLTTGEKPPPVPREGANSSDILDMIRRGREKARLMNPNSRRRRGAGAWRTPREWEPTAVAKTEDNN